MRAKVVRFMGHETPQLKKFVSFFKSGRRPLLDSNLV